MAPTFAYSDQKVFILGDSITQGFGLSVEDGLVNQLSNWFASAGLEVNFINGGVSGDTTAGGLERLSWSLTDDVSALVVALGANDVLRGFPPELTRENLSAIIDIAANNKTPVLLIGTYAPGNYGKQYKLQINAIITDDDEVHDVTINITSDYSTDPASIEIIFDHIHNSVFNVDTSFIADIPSGSMANYTIQISAEDMSGNSNSESVTFHVMD